LVKEETMKEDLKVGDVVAFLWGVSEVHGTVAEVYGEKGHRQVVIALDPETTVSLPIEDVRRAVAA
jgi:transcription antitermination factor NusG